MADSDASSVSSNSSSDDEEYLVSGKNEDREAMIRRKLLENFYGAADGDDPNQSDDDDSMMADGDGQKKSGVGRSSYTSSVLTAGSSSAATATAASGNKSRSNADIGNLDSTNFDPSLYTKNLIHQSSTHDLLSSTNGLSSSIRVLDSTMQTLVYENYSKFISATDAIRSIGQSVDVSNEGLDSLKVRMERMEQHTTTLEGELAQKRKQVVEKLKLKRLLTRLTRLVELPSTLTDLRSRSRGHKYRFAMQEYLDAMSILTQYTGFESLNNIEVECTKIIKDMIEGEVGLKLWAWCGGNSRTATGRRRRSSVLGKSGILDRFWLNGGKLYAATGAAIDMNVSPPNDIGEIYECASALLLYAQSKRQSQTQTHADEGSYDEGSNSFDELLGSLTEDECRAVVLESCSRYLESFLEDHAIEIEAQEDKVMGMNMNSDEQEDTELSLYPTKFLDSLLEAATLYSVTFRSKSVGDNNDVEILSRYVSMWFTSFLNHVKNIMLQHASEGNKSVETSEKAHEDQLEGKEEDDDDELFAKISFELMKLVRSVRETASGLALPEVGIDMEVASGLVEETVGITESMVRRRVMQKFRLLKIRVMKECISPFVSNVLQDVKVADEATIIRTVQSANIALSDGMQFVDDTIRSILTNGKTQGSSGPLDIEMVKVAVKKNARKFAFWLAGCLELIAGCDASDNSMTLDVRPLSKEEDSEDRDYDIYQMVSIINSEMDEEAEGEKKKINERENQLIDDLTELIEDTSSDASSDILSIALVEMCRLAQRNVSNNINQSIASSIVEATKSSKSEIFRAERNDQNDIDSDRMISTRFHLAASRSLAVFASTKGHEASSHVCYEVYESSSIQSEFFPHGPSDPVQKILEVTKSVCISTSIAFGSDAMASPLPDFSDDYRQDLMLTGASRFTSSTGNFGAIKGLSLDVARMFAQKVQIYPHPLDMSGTSFTRDHVVSLMLRAAFRVWIEQVRQCTFTTFAYRQMQVDVEFLKYMLPHYVNEDIVETLKSVLNDLLLNAGERCTNPDCVGAVEFHDEAMGKVLSPLSIALNFLKEEEAAGGRGALDNFVLRNAESKEVDPN